MVKFQKKRPTLWRRAVDEVLHAAGITRALLADALDVSDTVVSRYLSEGARARTPNRDKVLRVDREIARLADHPRIGDYLDSIAAACGLLQGEPGFGDEALAEAAARCLRWYGRFFKPGGVECVAEFMRALGEPERRKLVLGLNHALRRITIEELAPHARPVGFTTVFEALKTSGLAVEEVVSERSAEALAWEHFEWTVRRELATADPRAPANERLAAARRVLEAATMPALASVEVSPDSAAAGGLHEVKMMESGKHVSRFYGDPRAAWAPFTHRRES